MSAGKTLTFAPISTEQWTSIKSLVQSKMGIAITEDEGTGSKLGVAIRWSYSGNELQVQLVNREFFDPSETTIDADITEAVKTVIG